MTATILAPTDAAAPPRPRPRREPIALAALLIGTAVLYLWNLGASGWANSYYSGAVQAMTMSWKAFFFASLDAGNVITVDKPPAALWVMALSARIFGLSSWSILVPEALMGVATVALLYATVRRVAGARAALLAGAAMALTPVAVVMFRFNNPDALLVLLMVAAAYATTMAIEKAGTRWLLLAGTLIGFGFITKMAQALIVLPALAIAYLVAAPTGFWRRIRQLLAGGAAMVVAAGWWIATVELWPTDSRPYIGGSTTNSVMELALGYNGLGRIFGNMRGNGGGGAPGPEFGAGPPPGGGGEVFGGGGPGGFGGQAGLLRLFNEEIGGQVAWLLPAALVLLVAGLWLTRRAVRTDRTRAALVLWGGWTLVTALVFSFAEGIFHGYYTVALAPGIAALVGIGGHELWRNRSSWAGRSTLILVVAATAATAWVLLGRSPEFLPWLRWVVVALAAVAVLALLGKRWALAGLIAVLLTGALGPAAYAAQTAVTAHAGSMPSAGPAVERQQRQDGGGPRMMGRGPGEEQGSVDAALVTLLQQAGTSWSAAAPDSHTGTDVALASRTNVMSIGGFTGSDPAPTLAQFQAYVAQGKVHWYIDGGGGPGGRRQSEITTWVRDNFASTTVGGRTVYDLTKPLH